MTQAPADALSGIDAVLLLSFGGPEAPQEVMPFLRRVTAGRGVPDERLAVVAEHYLDRDGVSPINAANRALLAALTAELRRRGHQQPVAWGNRNAEPFVTEALAGLARGGARRVKVVTTSVYPSYSGCRQYREDLAVALAAQAGSVGLELELAEYAWYHEGFVAANADAVRAALAAVDVEGVPAQRAPEHGPRELGPARQPHVLFVTHSIPVAMNEAAGATGGEYVRDHQQVAQAVLEGAVGPGRSAPPHELVFCSRSGPPGQPWLEPDVNQRIAELAAQGCPAVVVAPIGFVSDHMEVVHDLDTEAAATAAQHGVAFARAATAGTHPAFVAALVDELESAPRRCAPGCCVNPRRPELAAACGAVPGR